MNYPDTLFITGTGTDVGKSYATGWLARRMMQEGLSVITQKLVQTGNADLSEDIDVHRRIMGIPLQPCDLDHTTAPVIFSYPASPHLAARIDGRSLDLSLCQKATGTLRSEYDHVLIEGAGGVMVPLTEDYLTIDYIRDNHLPACVVVNGQLGAINHAILTFEALKSRGIPVAIVLYNPYFDGEDKIIAAENRVYMARVAKEMFPDAQFIVMD